MLHDRYSLFFPLQLTTLWGWWVLLTTVVLILGIGYLIWGLIQKLSFSKKQSSHVIQKLGVSIFGRTKTITDAPQEPKNPTTKKSKQSNQQQTDSPTQNHNIATPSQEATPSAGHGVHSRPQNKWIHSMTIFLQQWFADDVLEGQESNTKELHDDQPIEQKSSRKQKSQNHKTREDNMIEMLADQNTDVQLASLDTDTDPVLVAMGEHISSHDGAEKEHDEAKEVVMTVATLDVIEQQTKSQAEREALQSELTYLRKKEDRDSYESKLIGGLSNNPEHREIKELLADFYMMDKQYKKSLPLYKQLVETYSSDHSLIRKLAQAYLVLDDDKTAQVLLDTALTLQPNTPKYAIDLVKIYYNNGDQNAALALMEQVVQWRPENMTYRDILINLYEERGDYNKLVNSYETMVTLDPHNSRLKRKLLEARNFIDDV